jgi:hypothetical protein
MRLYANAVSELIYELQGPFGPNLSAVSRSYCFHKIANMADLTHYGESVTAIIKFHGDFEDDGSLVLTETTLRRWASIWHRGGKPSRNRAIVAVARKLAVLLHRIWVTQELYIPFYAVAARGSESCSLCLKPVFRLLRVALGIDKAVR